MFLCFMSTHPYVYVSPSPITLHPPNTKMAMGNPPCSIANTSSNGGFSIAMLVFGGCKKPNLPGDGFPADPTKIYLTTGASEGVKRAISALIKAGFPALMQRRDVDATCSKFSYRVMVRTETTRLFDRFVKV